MIKLKINEILKSQGVRSPHMYLMEKFDMGYTKAYKICNNTVDKLSMRDLASLCVMFGCTPNELMYWEDTSKVTLPLSHPMKTNMYPPLAEYGFEKLLGVYSIKERDEILKNLLDLKKQKEDL